MLVSAIEDKIINIIESILQASSVKKAISSAVFFNWEGPCAGFDGLGRVVRGFRRFVS